MKKNMNKGFSLVELIIVIAIMAVLVGVLAPQFIKYVESSRQSTDIDTIAEIKSAVEAYVADESAKSTCTVDNVQIQWSGKTITVSGGCSAHAISGANSALDDLGIDGAVLKSDGWGGATVTYNTTTYRWTATGLTSLDVNSKKPCKDMVNAFN